MHGSSIERLTGMGIGADVPLFVAHFPCIKSSVSSTKSSLAVSRIIVLRGGSTRSLSNGDDYDGLENQKAIHLIKTAKALITLSARFLCYECTTNLSSRAIV